MSNNTPNTAPSKNDNSGQPAEVKQQDAGKPVAREEAAQPAAAPDVKKG